jgi:hypothetical protein
LGENDDEADLRENFVVEAAQHHTGNPAEQAHRHNQDDGKRQRAGASAAKSRPSERRGFRFSLGE